MRMGNRLAPMDASHALNWLALAIPQRKPT
jgi:hypothetical protein